MVDLIITYINNQDQVWRNTFIKYCREHNLRQYISKLANERYSGVNWLPYYLKLVKKNMAFIRKVFLVVSNKEQVSDIELTDNVEVVTHDKFIPYRYLPTFNSTTIEIFLPFIKGLSDKFIYSNDDMLPVGLLSENDFFVEDKIKLNWINETFNIGSSQFKYQCFNNCYLIDKHFKKPNTFEIKRPTHSMTPMIKEHCIECYNAISSKINKTISAFRNEYNFNQYIYPLWEDKKYGTLSTNIKFLYTEFKEQVDTNNQIICVNVERNKEYVNQFIEELKKICE